MYFILNIICYEYSLLLGFLTTFYKLFSSSTDVLHSPPFPSPFIWSCYENRYLVKAVLTLQSLFQKPIPILIFLYLKVHPTWESRIFYYLGITLTNHTRRTREIKPRLAMAKAAFNKKKTVFTSKLDLNLR